MAVPDFQSFMLPLLKFTADREGIFRTFFHNVIDIFGPDHRTSKDKHVHLPLWSYEEIPTN